MKKEIKQEYKDDCLKCCAAFYLNLPLKKVPHFILYKDWRRRLDRFFRRRNLKITPVRYNPKLLSNKRKLYIVQGKSPRTKSWEHAVVYKGKKRFFDPSQSNKFLKGRPTFIWIIKKIRNGGDKNGK